MPPLVSIVTVNHGGTPDTRRLLDRLAGFDRDCVQTIVVENGSPQPGQADVLRAHAPWATVVDTRANLGFAGGNNAGLEHARGRYVFFLNNDTVPQPGFLGPLLAALEADPRLGIVSPQIRFPDGRIQYAGCGPIHPWTGRATDEASDPSASGPTGLPHGAAMLVRREVLESVGSLSERFFLYYEEHDLAERARRAGWRIGYVAESVVVHHASSSVGEGSPVQVEHMTRGRLTYLRRNGRGLPKAAALAWFFGVALPVRLLRFGLQGRWDLARALVRGAGWHLKPRRVSGRHRVRLPERPAPKAESTPPHPGRPRALEPAAQVPRPLVEAPA